MLTRASYTSKSKATAVARLVLAGAVRHIWKERNLRTFCNEELNKAHRFQQLSADIKILFQASNWKEETDTNQVQFCRIEELFETG